MKSSRYLSWMGLLAAFLLALTACGNSQEPAPDTAAGQENGQALEETASDSPDGDVIRILHINDVHTNVEEGETAIGYPKIAAFFAQKREENPNTIVLDAGDTFAGTASGAFDNAESIPAILNTMGFDAMAAGNADYMLGPDRLLELAAAVDYPVLSGNTPYRDGAPFLEGSTALELENGTRVGIVSVTTQDSVRGFTDVYDFQSPVEVCQNLVDGLRDEVDLLIALVHLGDAEGSEYTSDRLAQEVTGIDVIVDGHSHTVLETGKVVNDVLITQAGEYSKFVGEIEIVMDGGAVASATARLYDREFFADLPEQENTAAALAALVKKREEYFRQVIGSTEVELVGTRDIVRTRETNLGNLFADAIRDAADADFALIIAGLVGGEIPPGDITKGDVLDIARVSQEVVVLEMTGADLIGLLEHCVGAYPEPSGGFAQVSGFTFAFDPAREEGRVVQVQVDGAPLDPDAAYRVAMNAGISEEADGTLLETLAETPEILEAYLVANSPVSPVEEGRITTVGESA